MALKTFERVARERHQEREKADTLWQTIAGFLERPEDGNYLGDPNVLEAIARMSIAKVIAARVDAAKAAAKGEPFPDPSAVATRAGEEFARIVLGQDPAYEIIGPQWNSPTGGIIGQIRGRYDLKDGDPVEIAAFPFWSLVRAYLDAAAEEAAGRDWQHILDAEVELCVAVLLGTDDILFPFGL